MKVWHVEVAFSHALGEDDQAGYAGIRRRKRLLRVVMASRSTNFDNIAIKSQDFHNSADFIPFEWVVACLVLNKHTVATAKGKQGVAIFCKATELRPARKRRASSLTFHVARQE